VRVDTVVVSVQHAPEAGRKQIEGDLRKLVIEKSIPKKWLDAKTRVLINPTGRFVTGGPCGDCGVTGRKIIVDTYGGMGRHGGGAFSGKDPSKVDRSAAYMARYIAKNVVAAGLAKRCEVQLAYAIGEPEPVSVRVDTFGTGTVEDAKLAAAVRKVFGLKPADIIRELDLLRPIYSKTNQYGHFGRKEGDPDFKLYTWEREDKAAALLAALAD
jgi:S-adenosylmethionine synthetase